MTTDRAAYRLARIVARLSSRRTYESHTGGIAYVDLRLLNAAAEMAEQILAADTSLKGETRTSR